MEKFNYLPESIQNVAEDVDAKLHGLPGYRAIFNALLKEVFRAGQEAKIKEYAEMARRDWEEEIRKPPRL